MALKTKAELLSEIATAINDNTSGDVTPADVRTMLVNMVDSMFPSNTWVQWTALGNNPPASGFGTFDTVSDLAHIDLDGGNLDESLVLLGYVPEGATTSGGAKVRVCWSPDTATSGVARLRVRVRKLDSETATWGAWTTVSTATVSSATDYIVTEITVASGDLDGIAARDFFVLEVGRNASDTTNDTMDGDAQIAAVVMEGA